MILAVIYAIYVSAYIEAWKIQDFIRVWTSDFTIPVRRSNQLSYETTDTGSWLVSRGHGFKPGWRSEFFRLLYTQLHKLRNNCKDHSLLDFTSAVQYMKNIPHRLIRTHKWPAPNISGFIAQMVRVSHLYREVTGWNPVEVQNFSGFYIRNCINCINYRKDRSLLDFTSAVQYMK